MRLLHIKLRGCIIIALLISIAWDLSAIQSINKSESVKIGLLITDDKSLAASNAAEMAIRKANQNGGFKGQPFQLVVRSMEGPWGTGSKQAVDLIFDENVRALVGSHDGRNAHLVEQVATKARIVFLSAWASDPTLAQAFVPWYFSCVPDDRQQSAALINQIYHKKNFLKVAVCSDSSYDSRIAVNSLTKKLKAAGKPNPVHFFYQNISQNLNDLTDHIKKADVDCIILYGQPFLSIKLIQQMRSKEMKIPVYGSLSLLNENQISDHNLKDYEGVVLISSGHYLGPKASSFINEYRRTFGEAPGEVAAYAYDGVNLIIEAIMDAGLDQEMIQKSLKEMSFNGVTGRIEFDEKGNRKGATCLIEILNGEKVPVKEADRQ